jgi:hypothetical protein
LLNLSPNDRESLFAIPQVSGGFVQDLVIFRKVKRAWWPLRCWASVAILEHLTQLNMQTFDRIGVYRFA